MLNVQGCSYQRWYINMAKWSTGNLINRSSCEKAKKFFQVKGKEEHNTAANSGVGFSGMRQIFQRARNQNNDGQNCWIHHLDDQPVSCWKCWILLRIWTSGMAIQFPRLEIHLWNCSLLTMCDKLIILISYKVLAFSFAMSIWTPMSKYKFLYICITRVPWTLDQSHSSNALQICAFPCSSRQNRHS